MENDKKYADFVAYLKTRATAINYYGSRYSVADIVGDFEDSINATKEQDEMESEYSPLASKRGTAVRLYCCNVATKKDF